jgi:hypothetical protein
LAHFVCKSAAHAVLQFFLRPQDDPHEWFPHILKTDLSERVLLAYKQAIFEEFGDERDFLKVA